MTPDSFTSLLNILAYGDDKQICSVIYLGDQLRQVTIYADLLSSFFRAPSIEHKLVEIFRYESGKFILLVISRSWEIDIEENNLPLMITKCHNQYKVVGTVMPFDELFELLSGEDGTEIGELTFAWIMRKQQDQSPKMVQ